MHQTADLVHESKILYCLGPGENPACMITRQIRKIQSIFVHAVHARVLPAWLAAEMARSSDFDPRARRQAVACAQN